MLDENKLKELLSLAAIQAIVSQAGYHVDMPNVDLGLDGEIQDSHFDPINKLEPSEASIKFQAKCTHNIKMYDDYITYPLRNKNYNILIQKRIQPMILILFVVPSERNLWLNICEDQLLIKKCAYWVDLTGIGNPKTSLESTTTIKIPRDQIFTCDTIETLLEKHRKKLKVIENLISLSGGDY